MIEYLLPLGKGQIRCYDDRAGFIAFIDDLKEEVGLLFIQPDVSEFIENQKFVGVDDTFEIEFEPIGLFGAFKLQQ